MTNPIPEVPPVAAKEKAPPRARSVLLGGLVPVILFTVIEEIYGVLWGLVAGMAFGICEVLYEWKRYGRVGKLTWFGNGLILGLGSISLLTREGLWFKLQPAVMEVIMGTMCVVSVLIGKPFMVWMAREQGLIEKIEVPLRARFERELGFFTMRMGIFFLLASTVATWSALYWSTRAWALTKGVGFTVAMLVYAVIEAFYMKYRMERLKD